MVAIHGWLILLALSLTAISYQGAASASPLRSFHDQSGYSNKNSFSKESRSSAKQLKCKYDKATQLGLDQPTFDQDRSRGWRALARIKGCEREAAELIKHYRRAHKSNDKILLWHEGQLRALAGQSPAAIRLMALSKLTGKDPLGLNIYTNATIAFLQDDLKSLEAARSDLANVDWPGGKNPNLRIVDGLISCFGRPYMDAYSGCEEGRLAR